MTIETTELQHWVAEALACKVEQLDWQPLAGDASFRRYFRCGHNGRRFIVALAPPATEKNHEFVHIARLLQQAEVKVPEVLAVEFERGFILQNDLGKILLADCLNSDTVDGWYYKAMLQLQQMLQVEPAELATLPLYNKDALALELSYFQTWFLEAMLGYRLTEADRAMLQQWFDVLLQSALAQPVVFVHRDYHCRNIMVCEDHSLATIDFQDALAGPITYDLVSLLRDCYVVWPDAQVTGWVADYWQLLAEQGLVDVELPMFQRWFDLMGLQRHIKVLGIFARLSIRDNKHGYLNDLPTVVNYVRRVARQQPEAEAFCHWFEAVVMPRVRKQSWGQAL